MPDLVLEYHRRKKPIDHPDYSVVGEKFYVETGSEIKCFIRGSVWGYSFEGKTVVSRAVLVWGASEEDFWKQVYGVFLENDFIRLSMYKNDVLSVIGNPSISIDMVDNSKAIYLYRSGTCAEEGVGLSNHVLSDVEVFYKVLGRKGELFERWQDITVLDNMYKFDFDVGYSTGDFAIKKKVNGTETELAREAIDLSDTTVYSLKAELVGSELRFYRDDFSTPKLTATDTDLASGSMGVGRHEVILRYARIFRKPYGSAKSLPKPLYVAEVEMEEESEGKRVYYRPKLLRDVRDGIDRLAVSYGGFEVRHDRNSIVFLFGNNPYNEEAVSKQIEFLKSMNLRVFRCPRDYREAIELYRVLRREFSYWLAGKDDFARMSLGLVELELFSLADFYYGELLEHKTHYSQLKRLDPCFLRQRLEHLVNKLSRISFLVEERDKHISKVRKILKLGW